MENIKTQEQSNFSEDQQKRYKEYGIMGSQCSAHFRKKLGKLLKIEREKRGLSIEEVSQKIYISLANIKNTEAGKKSRNWCIISALLKFYNKNLEIMLKDTPLSNK